MDFHAGVLRVMGKEAKEREVPFGAAARQALWSYVSPMEGLVGGGRGPVCSGTNLTIQSSQIAT